MIAACVGLRALPLRDMDVLTDFAVSVRLEGEEDCRVQLIEHLGAERRDAADKLRCNRLANVLTRR
jgi:hypothetical protein